MALPAISPRPRSLSRRRPLVTVVLVVLALLAASAAPGAASTWRPKHGWATVYAKDSLTTIRTAPSASAATAGSYLIGQPIYGRVTYGQGGRWIKSTQGFVPLSATSTTALPVVTVYPTVRALTVRSGPGASFGATGYVGMPLTLTGIYTPEGWLRIVTGHDTGFVSRAYLSTTAPPSSAYSGANGEIAPAALCSLPLQPTYLLRCQARDAWVAMDAAYAQSHNGTHLGVVAAYRPYYRQLELFDQLGYPRAAHPGTSNHGLGIAVDFGGALNYYYTSSTYKWLAANAAQWSWGQPAAMQQGGSNEEWWHWEFHPAATSADRIGHGGTPHPWGGLDRRALDATVGD